MEKIGIGLGKVFFFWTGNVHIQYSRKRLDCIFLSGFILFVNVSFIIFIILAICDFYLKAAFFV